MPSPREEKSREETLLLGIDHCEYGKYQLESQADARTACSISCGSDPESESRLHKGRADVPNEDALLAIDEGELTLLAVADSHHGHLASHELLSLLQEKSKVIPSNPLALLDAIRRCTLASTDPEDRSETTLCTAVINRTTGKGFGASFGDSSLLVIGQELYYANRKVPAFVTPREAMSLDPRRALEFSFSTAPGDLIACFTDGIDECHYRQPETSLGLREIGEIDRAEPLSFARSLTQMALNGLPGHPGGQDNIALIVSRA